MKLETASELRKTIKFIACRSRSQENLRFDHLHRSCACIRGEEIDRKRDALAKLLLYLFNLRLFLPSRCRIIKRFGGEHDTRVVFLFFV